MTQSFWWGVVVNERKSSKAKMSSFRRGADASFALAWKELTEKQWSCWWWAVKQDSTDVIAFSLLVRCRPGDSGWHALASQVAMQWLRGSGRILFGLFVSLLSHYFPVSFPYQLVPLLWSVFLEGCLHRVESGCKLIEPKQASKCELMDSRRHLELGNPPWLTRL